MAKKQSVAPGQAQAPSRAVLVVTGDLFFRLQDYHRAAGIPGTISDTARELLRSALDAPASTSALVMETRRRGYRQVRNDAIKRFQEVLGQIARDFGVALGTYSDDQLDLYFTPEAQREESA